MTKVNAGYSQGRGRMSANSFGEKWNIQRSPEARNAKGLSKYVHFSLSLKYI